MGRRRRRVALIRDGNGTRSFETLLRYRGPAMAEFWRALRTLKALQAEQAGAVEQVAGAGRLLEAQPERLHPPPPVAHCAEANEPEHGAGRRLQYVLPESPAPDHPLHEPAGLWLPNEPEAAPARHARAANGCSKTMTPARPNSRRH